MVKSQPKDQLILWGEYSGIKIKAISYAPPAAAGKSKLHENNMSYPRPCNRVGNFADRTTQPILQI